MFTFVIGIENKTITKMINQTFNPLKKVYSLVKLFRYCIENSTYMKAETMEMQPVKLKVFEDECESNLHPPEKCDSHSKSKAKLKECGEADVA